MKLLTKSETEIVLDALWDWIDQESDDSGEYEAELKLYKKLSGKDWR
jgi:hypothetical protein